LKAYADSSFIVALYLQEQKSATAAVFMRQYGIALPFTPWHRLEVRNAMRLAVFHRAIESIQGKAQLEQLEIDLREKTLVVHTPIDWVSVLRKAEHLGSASNEFIGCRSSDLFHVASALEWGADQFLTFDDRQKKMVKAAGLTVGLE
jgi:predicted nucleic acid-binding protein